MVTWKCYKNEVQTCVDTDDNRLWLVSNWFPEQTTSFAWLSNKTKNVQLAPVGQASSLDEIFNSAVYGSICKTVINLWSGDFTLNKWVHRQKNGRKLFSGFHHQYWKAHTVFFFPVLTPLPTHSLLAASPCSYLWNEKKENKSTASCWTKTCSFPRICVTIVDGENGLLLKERKCPASYFQKQSTTCINVFISTFI